MWQFRSIWQSDIFFACSSHVFRQPGMEYLLQWKLKICTIYCTLKVLSTLKFMLRVTTPLYLVTSKFYYFKWALLSSGKYYAYANKIYNVRGRLGAPYIHLFVYICCSYRMVALMLCYHSIAQSTCKDDISASAICHL